MKIIDLLNKIANGDELPKKIKFNNKIYTKYNSHTYKDYEGTELEEKIYIIDSLNEEVEIIEEDKKIKRIQSCGDNLYSEYIGQWLVNKENYTEYDELLMNKINEIIDKLNAGVDKE